ncbi:TonB-dependent receptor [Sphingopyxis macrogoltabida]|uniref:TonB-dependent receptor n=1 Tax=Sphingopyxis macrogoltabida TaxID=33050 RepID=A0AAC9AUI9_SPHMC|nr:TonB-dependent receptor [Sphingopyxis macrogoltabida]ALJ13987.1 TonB-dependent receptor [Sphingopyxis macrogoltabida]AMU88577.1 TonB-dependent receptor [Sphingopyxis macrogoltabida]
MKFKALIGTSILAMTVATPAFAQDAPAETERDAFGGEIVVTAQRQSERLQDVPIAVSAFSSEALEAQQIKTPSDLQLTLPNVTFTKTNFTGASFTIRGIGDLCVGTTCDSATAIHLNGDPLFSTRLFETEFFDLERIEVLRGPQGTLFGRNATSGVVNVITAKPKLGLFEAAAEGEYGNYDSIKGKAMVNIPIGDTIALRVAGIYLNRDGYTKNTFLNTRIDDRDLYSVRGSLRWEPTDNTTIDLMGSYFREKDQRTRIQKQLCQRDPTGILGCLNTRLDNSPFNGNSTFTAALTSREFLATQGIPAAFALGSLYGPDVYGNTTIPADPRTVNTAYTPSYFTSELTLQGQIEHDFGPVSLQVSGQYQKVKLDASQDYNSNVGDRSLYAGGLGTLQAAANGAFDGILPGFSNYIGPVAAAIIPDGPGGQLCTSLAEESGFGSFGGNKICSDQSLQFDRSNQYNSSWSVESILTSDLDGPFNFLIGGIYADYHLTENSYYVNAFPIDYLTGVLGAFNSYANGLPPSFLGTPFFRNNTGDLKIKSYGIFGETYFEVNDKLKLTLGLRYNNDKKTVVARSTLASFLVPFGQTGTAFDSPFVVTFDADPGTPGNQIEQRRSVKFNEWTGRAVVDYKITDDNLLYASYSRGYKSGGINPPLQPIFEVPESFQPEQVDAFEIGSKNAFGGGALQLNLTAFYYKYKKLQLSKIVARTAVNDNVDADIYGFEIEGMVRPDPDWVINLGFSYLHTKVTEDKFTSNPRDFGGGRSDAVIIKDITNAANCAVAPGTSGNAAGSNAFVNFVNNAINAGIDVNGDGTIGAGDIRPGAGLQGTTAFPADGGIASTGAFSICGVLQSYAAAAGNLFDPNGIQVFTAGIPVNIKGNQLPQAPNYKFSAGVQYTAHLGDMTLVPRVDLAYTGESYGSIFNGNVNRIKGYAQVNAQLQLNGADDKWFVKGFIQNIFNANSVTGLYITDQSSGNYTNIFTLEPRRYGIAAGVRF